jgi:hypothetical protein
MAIKRHKPEEIVAKLRQVPAFAVLEDVPAEPRRRDCVDRFLGSSQGSVHVERG